MRKLMVSAVFLVALSASLAAPALASFDPNFKVVTKAVHQHELSNGGTAFYEKLIDPHRTQNKVGYDHGFCKPAGPVAAFCKATFHLDGEIGGHGDITVAGKVFQGSTGLKVVDGTDAFAGVRGSVEILQSDLGNRYGIQIFHLH